MNQPVSPLEQAALVAVEAPTATTVEPVQPPPFVVELARHTLVVLCGPTSCGKSTFAEELEDSAQKRGFSTFVASSDGLRRSMLATSYLHGAESLAAAHNGDMLSVSVQAFSLMYAQLEARMSFPVSTDLIIVDTTGMDLGFRTKLADMAKTHHYATALVVFDFKDKAHYGLRRRDDLPEEVQQASVTKFRKRILPELKANMFDKRVRVPGVYGSVVLKDTSSFLFDDFSAPEVFCTGSAAFIGDTHECVEELKELMAKLWALPGMELVTLVGDYLDKGGATKEMVELVYDEVIVKKRAKVLKANHEHYIAMRLLGEIGIDPDPKIEASKFPALAVLEADPVLKDKFLHIWAASMPFLWLISMDTEGNVLRRTLATHAPCQSRFLGKIDSLSLRNQRNFRYGDDPVANLKFVFDEAESCMPIHVFGHVAHSSPKLMYGNKVFLDTGCVYGGPLTAMVVRHGYADFVSVPSKGARMEITEANALRPIPRAEDPKEFSVYDYDLDSRDFALLDNMRDSGAAYMSGTMAPGPSIRKQPRSVEDKLKEGSEAYEREPSQLEGLDPALDYFQNLGCVSVMLQPKYMGSRAQLYLDKDSTKSFGTSRAGWTIRHVPALPAMLEAQAAEHASLFKEEMVLDAELGPWAAMGQGLIDRDYRLYETVVGAELAALAEDPVFQAYDIGKEHELPERQRLLTVFSKTLERFATNEEPWVKPFDILRIDGKIHSSAGSFCAVNTDETLVVTLADVTSRKAAGDYFAKLTLAKGMEGVVIKPFEEVSLTGKTLPPYMKVRSPEYLTLIYGYDYQLPRRYERLCGQKNISGKVRAAIREHGWAMKTLAMGTFEERKPYFVKMIADIKRTTAELDPRL
jgi:predicted kinase